MESNQEEQKPRSPRLRSLLGGKIMVKGQSSFDCIIKSKSETGFGLKMGSTAGVPDEFQLLEEKIHKNQQSSKIEEEIVFFKNI